MRRFDACALCLNRAREPLACDEGHLFCKECVYTDLLTQKKDIKRQKDKLKIWEREYEEEKARARETARERVLLEFEKSQLGLAARPTEVGTKGGMSTEEGRGTKRKFEFDTSVVEGLQREAEEAAMRKIEKEQAEVLKSKLPDFWLPSLTPTYTSTGPPTSLGQVKIQTMCRGGNPAHALSLKSLSPVKFTFYDRSSRGGGYEMSPPAGSEADASAVSSREDQDPICPSCKKQLSNNILLFMMKPCGHVACKTCTDTLVRSSEQCVACDQQLKGKDILELKREGTGYAGGGLAETSKTGIAFQG
ncbi:Nitric oxide synthase-interacting protein [Leucoagaricus sp. SymC.cos]|nr:Nitric oxide synthase-interacting protein [Leucoagaricus sp. SymC.cos]